MRLDHIAYRVKDRQKTASFFIEAFGYRVQEEFQIDFEDGSCAKCIALEPPEKVQGSPTWVPHYRTEDFLGFSVEEVLEYHQAPEIFVSDGTADSIVGQWVADRDGIGGIHHLAYEVNSIMETVKEWKEKGYAEFASDNVLKCEGLTQIFTKPSELTGVIYEFIERSGAHGFCKENVKDLMESTKE